MNIGKDNRHPKYICDKCNKTIYYEAKKGYKGLNKYYKQKPVSDPPKRSFDLCEICEEKFREWLDTKEIPTFEETLKEFEIFEEEK